MNDNVIETTNEEIENNNNDDAQVDSASPETVKPATAKRGRKSKQENTEPKKTPHLLKVEKLMAGLPELSDDALEIFEVARDLSVSDIGVLIAHLNAHARLQGVQASAKTEAHKVGSRVRCVSGSTKFLGLEGIVSKSQRIRCYVDFDGFEKPGYFFHSDVIAIEQDSEQLVEVPTENTYTGEDEVIDSELSTGTDG